MRWSQSLLSDQMDPRDEPADGRYTAAVAAAALAISSRERGREGQLREESTPAGSQRGLSKTKSRKESSGMGNPSDSGRISRWFTIKEDKEDRESAGELPKPRFFLLVLTDCEPKSLLFLERKSQTRLQ